MGLKNKDVFPITGFTSDEQFSFYGNEQYEFTFMQNKLVFSGSGSIESKDGFLRCVTHQGAQVAINCGSELPVRGVQKLSTYCFMISNGMTDHEIEYFNEITFEGGTLNQLFTPRKANMEPGQEQINVQLSSDAITLHFMVDEETHCEAKVESAMAWSMGTGGTELHNTDVRFTMRLDRLKPLSFSLECYRALLHCMRFMMNRREVGVDSITLFELEEGKKHYECGMFDVYIKRMADLSEKDRFRNITFEDLGDSLSKLMEMYFLSTDEKRLYSLGFYPASDSEAHVIDNNTIRSICSALEFEADQESEVKPELNPELDKLIKGTKKFVKDYRKEHDGISNSTYDRIFTSMNFWSFSARDKIEKLWNLHRHIMMLIQRQYRGEEPSIGEFVKYRNRITHGAEAFIPENVGLTTLLLRGLVYCCVLKRIGVSEEKMLDMMQYGKVNS